MEGAGALISGERSPRGEDLPDPRTDFKHITQIINLHESPGFNTQAHTPEISQYTEEFQGRISYVAAHLDAGLVYKIGSPLQIRHTGRFIVIDLKPERKIPVQKTRSRRGIQDIVAEIPE